MTEMKSFLLKDLVSVKVIKMKQYYLDAKIIDPVRSAMYEKSEIAKMCKVNETCNESPWPFIFKIEFVQRSFTLSARRRREFDEWIRIFKLIIKMNNLGFSVKEKNPYFFEH